MQRTFRALSVESVVSPPTPVRFDLALKHPQFTLGLIGDCLLLLPPPPSAQLSEAHVIDICDIVNKCNHALASSCSALSLQIDLKVKGIPIPGSPISISFTPGPVCPAAIVPSNFLAPYTSCQPLASNINSALNIAISLRDCWGNPVDASTATQQVPDGASITAAGVTATVAVTSGSLTKLGVSALTSGFATLSGGLDRTLYLALKANIPGLYSVTLRLAGGVVPCFGTNAAPGTISALSQCVTLLPYLMLHKWCTL